MPVPKKNVEAAHTIISLTLLATGQLILATEKRVYQLMDSVWQPMVFADDPVDETTPEPAAEPVTETKP